MKRRRGQRDGQGAVVGVVQQGHRVDLVTLDEGGALLDRRGRELTQGLPTHPHHHEGSWAVGRYLQTPGARRLPLGEALALVEQVRASAQEGARVLLDEVAEAIAVPIRGLAVRACPAMPPSVEATIRDARAQTVADGVMYRRALAAAAEERGAWVDWYEPETVAARAAEVLGGDLDARLRALGEAAGTPWRASHKLAATAALAAWRASAE